MVDVKGALWGKGDISIGSMPGAGDDDGIGGVVVPSNLMGGVIVPSSDISLVSVGNNCARQDVPCTAEICTEVDVKRQRRGVDG